jgi:hypothetical protein
MSKSIGPKYTGISTYDKETMAIWSYEKVETLLLSLLSDN